MPQLPRSYVSRPSLLERLDGVLDRRLTVLRAPAGFGKTTVLADVARGLRQRDLLVAWVSLDGDDTPNLFDSYLAAAFQHAGLDLTLLDGQDVWSSSAAVRQLGMLARAIELHGAPCLLVLDEVDRLPRRTLELIDLLVKHAPDDLHHAVAGRSDPRLELASQLFAGDAAIVGPPHFRFSRADGFHAGKVHLPIAIAEACAAEAPGRGGRVAALATDRGEAESPVRTAAHELDFGARSAKQDVVDPDVQRPDIPPVCCGSSITPSTLPSMTRSSPPLTSPSMTTPCPIVVMPSGACGPPARRPRGAGGRLTEASSASCVSAIVK